MLILSKSIIALLLGYILSISLGFVVVPFLKRLNISQSVSKKLNERHSLKEGTPTMGGITFIIPSILIVLFLIINHNVVFNINFAIIIIAFLLYAFLGFLDDLKKIKYHNNEGISIMTKFTFEFVIALIVFFLFIVTGNSTELSFLGFQVDLKYFYGIFILLIFTSTTNAVNITDGLDGLCAGISLIVYLTYGIIAWKYNFIIGNEIIAIFCFIMVGSLLGFLFFNFYPAKVFMGDLGSLALGGSIAAIAIVLKIEVSLLIVGFVYIIETISSLLQIIWIKIFNKRLFYKSPLHHHFEEIGLAETDIIKIFYMMSVLSSLVALLIYVW